MNSTQSSEGEEWTPLLKEVTPRLKNMRQSKDFTSLCQEH